MQQVGDGVLLVGPAELLEAAASRLGHLAVTPCADGAVAFEAYAKALREGPAPRLVVTELAVDRIGGASLVRAMRALERAWGARPTATLLYAGQAADADLKAFIAEVGQTVHLERPVQMPIPDQAARLQAAVDRLLAQLKGG
ncbi:MAG: hypothetical protein H6706_15875 [Myxococcales bacterium]|nr:hypothetical protein [Myxococcales bacterium]